jgi:hypothetical protein
LRSLAAEKAGSRQYRLGVGVDWYADQKRHVGFLTVAHSFWRRSLKRSTDTVHLPEIRRDFWLKAIVIPEKPTASGAVIVDGCILELGLLSDPEYLTLVGQAPTNLSPGNAQHRQNIIANSPYFSTTSYATIDVAAAIAYGNMRALMHFEGTPATQNWCLVTDHFDRVGPTDNVYMPDPPSPPRQVNTGALENYMNAVRAVRRDSSMERFDYGYSGQAWQVNNQLLGIQVGAINPDSDQLPGPIGYAHLVHTLIQYFGPLMQQQVQGYQPGSLRVVSVF